MFNFEALSSADLARRDAGVQKPEVGLRRGSERFGDQKDLTTALLTFQPVLANMAHSSFWRGATSDQPLQCTSENATHREQHRSCH